MGEDGEDVESLPMCSVRLSSLLLFSIFLCEVRKGDQLQVPVFFFPFGLLCWLNL